MVKNNQQEETMAKLSHKTLTSPLFNPQMIQKSENVKML